MNVDLKKYFPFLVVIPLIMLFNSCGMWTNLTAYYNRFYIAETAFETGIEEIELSKKKPLFQFKEEKLPSKANKNFDEVIKYSSKILQFNQDSKYMHEAIYMIAKSYYYKGQYNKGLRKFIELDGLNDEKHGLSAKLWIAKCEVQMRNFDSALKHFEEVKKLSIANNDEEVLFQVYVSEISYLIYREDFFQAISKIEELIEQALEDEEKSEVTYELGMLYISLGNYEKGVAAFELVDEGSPTFDIEFKSRFEHAKAIKFLDREEEALQRLSDLRDDTKYEPHWDIIDLEIAQIELESGEIETALEIFYSIDTGYTKNESSGIAAFMQGDIMEHIYMDYDSAKILYGKVASKKAPNDYKVEAKLKVNLLKSREDYYDKIFTSKMGYSYLRDTTLFKQDSIAYAGYLSRRDSVMQIAKDRKEAEGGVATNTTTRRKTATRGTGTALKQMFKYEEDSLFTYAPKLPLVSVDSVLSQIAQNEYELGNLYFTDLLVPDSAFFYYQDVINNYPNTKYHAKTLYSLGSYYLTLENKEKADSLFQYVYDNYNSDPIAKIAAVRLGISIEEVNSDPALEKYYTAESFIEEEEYFDAIEELNSIYEVFPESQYAPKALYSIGWVYENKLSDFDGAVDYYDTLKAKYPKTEYVRDINSRLTFYHSEKKAFQDSVASAEKAIQDSIANFEKVISDSLKADSLAQFNIDSLANAPLITDSTSIVDSVLIVDSTSIVDSVLIVDSTSVVDSVLISDSTSIVDSVIIDDSTKIILDSNAIKEDTTEVLSEREKAENLFKQQKEPLNKGKK